MQSVSEGCKYKNGEYIAAAEAKNDGFGHAMLGGAGQTLKNMILDMHKKCETLTLTEMVDLVLTDSGMKKEYTEDQKILPATINLLISFFDHVMSCFEFSQYLKCRTSAAKTILSSKSYTICSSS